MPVIVLARASPLQKINDNWRQAHAHPSLGLSVFFLLDRLDTGADWRVLAPLSQANHRRRSRLTLSPKP